MTSSRAQPCPNCGRPVLGDDFQCAACELLLNADAVEEQVQTEPSLIRALLAEPSRRPTHELPVMPSRAPVALGAEPPAATERFEPAAGPEMVPRLVAGLEIVGTLNDFEAYVTSFIDGGADVPAIARASRLSAVEVQAILRSMRDRELIELIPRPKPVVAPPFPALVQPASPPKSPAASAPSALAAEAQPSSGHAGRPHPSPAQVPPAAPVAEVRPPSRKAVRPVSAPVIVPPPPPSAPGAGPASAAPRAPEAGPTSAAPRSPEAGPTSAAPRAPAAGPSSAAPRAPAAGLSSAAPRAPAAGLSSAAPRAPAAGPSSAAPRAPAAGSSSAAPHAPAPGPASAALRSPEAAPASASPRPPDEPRAPAAPPRPAPVAPAAPRPPAARPSWVVGTRTAEHAIATATASGALRPSSPPPAASPPRAPAPPPAAAPPRNASLLQDRSTAPAETGENVLQRAVALERAGDVDGAIQTLKRAISRVKNPAALYNRLALILINQRRSYDEAERLLRQAMELDPDNPVYQQNLIKVVALAATQSNPGKKQSRGLLDRLRGRK